MTKYQISGLVLLIICMIMVIMLIVTVMQRRKEYQKEDKLSREVYRRKSDD